jgi:phage tail sheath gpL-like
VSFFRDAGRYVVPGQYQEVDNSLAGSTGEIKKTLIIAYKSAAGTAPGGTPVRVLSEHKAAALFGYGSPAAKLAKIFLELNKVEECWVLLVGAPQAATPWRKTYTAAVTTAQQGAAAITVNGAKIDAAAIAAAEQVAAAIVARINSEIWLPVETETGEGGAREPLRPARRPRISRRSSPAWGTSGTTTSFPILTIPAISPPWARNLPAGKD